MNDDEKEKNAVKTKIIALIKEGSEPKAKPKATRIKASPTIQVTGDNAQVAARDINHHTTINHFNAEKAAPRPKVVVKTSEGVITAEQKARLQQLVTDWITAHNDVKKTAKTRGAAWSAVNKQAKVNSYHEISSEKFSAVEKWLLRQIAIINAMPSAKAKSSTWRTNRIKAIQSRCNELGIQDKRKEYMRKTFGKDSLIMLSDDDVEKVYRWVMAKR